MTEGIWALDREGHPVIVQDMGVGYRILFAHPKSLLRNLGTDVIISGDEIKLTPKLIDIPGQILEDRDAPF